MTRAQLLASIALKIQDYRPGAWNPGPTPAHVDRWVSQFDPVIQQAILIELDHLLTDLYISRGTASTFLANLAVNPALAGPNPPSFWRSTGLLNIQAAGTSQRDMLVEFDQVLNAGFGFGVAQCAATSGSYVYLDDAVFTGTRLGTDLASWVHQAAPPVGTVHVIVMGLHRGGTWHATQKITKAEQATKKKVTLKFWRCVEIEDRLAYLNNNDVLRPSALPADLAVQAYAASLTAAGYAPKLRTAPGVGQRPKEYCRPRPANLVARVAAFDTPASH